MYCTRCGADAPEGASFCSRCGASLSDAPAGTPGVGFEPATTPAGSVPGWPPMSAEISQATINPSATTPVPATAPTSFPGVRYGGFWRRTAAFWVDLALAWLFGTLLLMALRLEVTQPDHFEPRTLLSLGIRLIVAWLYRSVFMSSRAQATPGQLLLNLKITDLEGRRISFARATGRYFAEWISFMICLIGYVMIAFSDRKQALHDKLAGCLVVHAKPSAAAVSPGPGSAAPTGA